MSTTPKQSPSTAWESLLLLRGAATAAALIGVATLGLEIWTERWMARAMGFDVFMSLPLGLAMVALTVLLTRTRSVRVIALPAICSVAYWAAFFVYL